MRRAYATGRINQIAVITVRRPQAGPFRFGPDGSGRRFKLRSANLRSFFEGAVEDFGERRSASRSSAPRTRIATSTRVSGDWTPTAGLPSPPPPIRRTRSSDRRNPEEHRRNLALPRGKLNRTPQRRSPAAVLASAGRKLSLPRGDPGRVGLDRLKRSASPERPTLESTAALRG